MVENDFHIVHNVPLWASRQTEFSELLLSSVFNCLINIVQLTIDKNVCLLTICFLLLNSPQAVKVTLKFPLNLCVIVGATEAVLNDIISTSCLICIVYSLKGTRKLTCIMKISMLVFLKHPTAHTLDLITL